MTDKHNILCVDDDLDVLESLKRIFRADFNVDISSKPLDALEMVRQKTYALIISDYKMPKMNGIDFLKEVRDLSPSSVRIMLSANIDFSETVEAINKAEIHKLFLKPWDNELLKLQINEALQTHELIKKNKELYILSITDPITQLHNHRYFQEKLAENINDKTVVNLALIMLDIDHFKSFNDRYGHPEGDKLLAHVGNRLKSLFAEPDITARYGGEEFCIILPHTTPEDAFKKAEELRLSLANDSLPGPNGRPAYITISLGLAFSPQHSSKANQLIEIADRALYKAKESGRNQTIVAP